MAFVKRSSPPKDELRTRLAAAIERHEQVSSYLDRVEAARRNLDQKLMAIYGEMTAAETELEKAKSDAPRLRVAQLVDGSASSPAAVDHAASVAAAAEAAHRSLQTDQQMLDAEIEQACTSLRYASSTLNDAVLAVLKADPGVGELLAELHETRRCCLTIEAALAALPAGTLPPFYDAHRNYAPDHALADRWRDAVAALKLDAGADLPRLRPETPIFEPDAAQPDLRKSA